MAIESEVKRGGQKSCLPMMRKSKATGLVVLFISSNTGVVVVKSEVYEVGHFSGDWTRYNDDSQWEDFTGEIILKNK